MRIAMIGQKGFEIGQRGGGIEQHVRALSLYLGRRGHEVTVYARRRYDRAEKAEGAERPGVDVRFVPTIYRKNLEAIVHTFLCTVDALLRDYDIIHYHGVGPATLAWIPRLLKPKTRVVVTFHSQDQFHAKWGLFARKYLEFGEWAACEFPHATLAVSHVIKIYARNRFHKEIIYIPNGAEVQNVTATDEIKTFGLVAGKYVLNVGRLVPHKGIHTLIEGWKMAKGAGGSWGALGADGWKLVIVGAATYTSDYEKKLRASIEGRDDILMLGYQSGESLRQLFAHAYLYVQPSESEGLPVVVLEAMSYGRPVLVSDIPENLEAMKNAGFSFENKNVDDLAKKLGDLIAHPEIVAEAAKSTQEVVLKHFNWEIIAVHTEAVYLSIRGGG
ncbi:MAG: glycosyltransferase family 4 protein [Candidatus Uhrbacteria bacterium]